VRTQPIPVIVGSYADTARPWSAQDVLNWIPTEAEVEGSRTPTKYMTPPGLKPFVEVGTGVVRGTYNCEGRLFAVIGTMLYRISNTGVAIPIGNIPGVIRVAFAHNQITGGNEVLIVNGSSGYVYNTVNDTLTRITDEGYPGAISADFIDGYLIQIEPARRFAFHSDLSDALSYNTLDRFTSEVSPDLLVGSAVSNNELLLLSERTAEFFENTGATQQPFRSKRITMDKGCAGRYTIATTDNTVFWLGDDGCFYTLDGYSPRRISTRPIEQSILGLNWAQAFAFVWEQAGHTVVYWTFPDGLTWGYDASTRLWHRRGSYGLSRWRANTMTFWNYRWIAGDFQSGRLWDVDPEYFLEGDQEFISECTTGVIHDNQNRVLMPRLELLFDVGQAETVPVAFPVQPDAPTITGDAPNGGLGASYAGYQYVISGGTGVLEVTIRSGGLPPGLTIDADGLIDTGTPTELGGFEYVVRVTDSNGLWSEITDSISIVMSMILSAFSGASTVIIPSSDGLDWSAAPIATGGNANNAIYLQGVPGAYIGHTLGGATRAAHSATGASWSLSSANVVAGPEECYLSGIVLISGRNAGVYRSSDLGANYTLITSGSVTSEYISELTADAASAATISQFSNSLFFSADSGATWVAGVNHGLLLTNGGASGTDGANYYFGGRQTATATPKLIRVAHGASPVGITLPTLTGAISVNAFAYASAITTKVIGTDNGRIAYDNGDGNGFRVAATTLAHWVRQLVWNGANFVAVTTPTGGGNGALYTSFDGDTWTQATMTARPLSTVAQIQESP